MTILCAMFNMINRINDSLDVELEDTSEIDKIQKSLILEPNRMTDYLTWLANFWQKEYATSSGMILRFTFAKKTHDIS